MTNEQFIKFSKEYFGDLDYTKLSVSEYKRLYEEKEAERINSMIQAGKIDISNILSIKADGMNITLLVNNKPVSSANLVYINPNPII
jgi:histidinol phosphatase-like PHP family hydrolase